MSYDLKITGGTLIDGTGSPGIRADLGIKDGRIVAIGTALDSAKRTIRADGQIVAPGFVDIHTHYDAQILWDPMLTVSPWHGVTSVVMGNCGFGVAPTRPEHRNLILRTLEHVEGMSLAALEAGLGYDWGFESFPEYLDAVERRGMAINVGVLVGHTPVRTFVMGRDAVERVATEEEVAKMQDIVVEALKAGAVGFSTSVAGLHLGYDGKPVPSRLADFDEILAMAGAIRRAGSGIFHWVSNRMPTMDKHIALAKESGATVTWGAILAGSLGPNGHREPLKRTAELNASGLRIYPQTACRPIVFEVDMRSPVPLNNWTLFEPVAKVHSDNELRRIYQDVDFRKKFRDAFDQLGDDTYLSENSIEGRNNRGNFQQWEISWNPPEPALEGRQLASVAAERGQHVVDLLLDLALSSNLEARFRAPSANANEDELQEILQDPNVVLSLSDAGAHMSQLCDACYSTHLLSRWVRERKALTLERAIHMMTGRTAEIFGITDRGRLALGWPADVVVFDPDTVGAGPLQRVNDLPAAQERMISKPSGISAVIVNGTVLPPPGEAMPAGAALPGKLLRNGRALN